MDLDQLKKINQLSSELKRHHMADSSTDAYSQAQGIVTIEQKPKVTESNGTVLVEKQTDALAERQFQLELERVQKGYTEELETLRNAVNQLITEVNSLRDDLSKVQSAPPAKPKQKEKQAELPKAKESHPRQGEFSPGDVSIQEMFYFGTKK